MVDPRQLKPIELLRLLNSTPVGTVADERQLRKLRNQAGYRIGDDRTIDLFSFTAWLFDETRAEVLDGDPGDDADQYGLHKLRAATRQQEISRAGREIGDIPAVADPKRRDRCAKSLKLFCETYLQDAFNLPWSQDHDDVIQRIEAVVFQNDLFACAMPRGTGKTALAAAGVLWAILYAYHEYIIMIAANDLKSTDLMNLVRVPLQSNPLLMSDFPEVCYPIKRLDNIPNRTAGQICNGIPTAMEWGGKRVILPTIEGAATSGKIFQACGIESGDILGAQHLRTDGRIVRPTLAFIDDPQTPESSISPAQTEKRLQIITRSILGLAGPERKIAAIMPCTVIAQGDLSDELTDRSKHPEWHGERSKFLLSFPDDLELWEQYWQIRCEEMMNDADMTAGKSASTKFYRQRRAPMDAGAQVSWPARYDRKTEISAIQFIMNIYLKDPAFFYAEMQNEPMQESGDAAPIEPDDIYRKLNRRARRSAPTTADRVTAFIDVQDTLLYWCVTAWKSDFTGYVLDYGVYPQQGNSYFTLRNARRTLGARFPGYNKKAAWYAGFQAVTDVLCATKYLRDDGVEMSVSRLCIDASDGEASGTVYQFCKESEHRAVLIPSRGFGVTAKNRPFEEYTKQRGHRVGHHWRIQPTKKDPSVRYLLIDTNYWKSHVRNAWKTGQGDSGSLSIFGENPQFHRMFADHCQAEIPSKDPAQDRVVEVWTIKRNKPDNHFFDALVGCAAAASEQGCALAATGPAQVQRRRRKKKYVKLSELRNEKKKN